MPNPRNLGRVCCSEGHLRKKFNNDICSDSLYLSMSTTSPSWGEDGLPRFCGSTVSVNPPDHRR